MPENNPIERIVTALKAGIAGKSDRNETVISIYNNLIDFIQQLF